ncbi:hypothetical protein ABT093_26720 [Kitasatospora sp. NPDC002551]|uniref:hypothetical protein n=1 Tax=unclassified Kitasatospora TaxID=2633591 RepID=UPI00332C135E
MADNDPPHRKNEPYAVRRPEASVLDSRAVVPRDNVVRPPPNQFTHTLITDQPYWYDHSSPGGPPDGTVPAGTPVALLIRTGDRCRAVTPTGLYVTVPCPQLRPLPGPHRDRSAPPDAAAGPGAGAE